MPRGRPLGSKNRPKVITMAEADTTSIDSTDFKVIHKVDSLPPAEESESYRPKARKNRKNRQTLEARLLALASQQAEIVREMKEIAEELRNQQDVLVKKVREAILDQ